jgi:hypothetical protein
LYRQWPDAAPDLSFRYHQFINIQKLITDMKKLIFIFIISISLQQVYSQIQSIDFPLKSANQQLIEDAVGEGLFIVHTSYRLKDKKGKKPQFYGWENQPYFGETLSLGVKTRTGFILDARAVTPWLSDARFDAYRDDNSYEPVVFESRFTSISDTASSLLNVSKTEPVAGGNLYLSSDTVFRHRGFPVDNADGLKQGWLVWLVAPDSSDINDNILVYRNETEFRKGHTVYPVKTPSRPVLGGLFIVPRIEDIGQITFYLCGIAVDNDGQWQIVRTGISSETSQPKAVKETPTDRKKDGLTPIKQ